MDTHWRRLRKIADADRSEWQRTVEENRAFADDIQQLRLSFSLPVVGFKAFISWLENTEAETQDRLRQEIRDLMKKHNVREKWYEPIWNRVIGGDSRHYQGS